MNRPVQGNYEFVFDTAGRRVSAWGLQAATATEVLIYADSKSPIATQSSGSTNFLHYNWVGTKRAITIYNGDLLGTVASLPFGDAESFTGSNDDWIGFAGMDDDLESGTEHAQFRQYEQNHAHWMSPDPYYGSYDFTNPQSFNRYSYALNNPVALFDPSGLECVWGDGSYDASDDPDTGDPDDCVAQGGTYVPPGIFENWAGTQPGTWSSSPSASVADWNAPVNVNAGPGTPLSGTFDFGNITEGQFIQMMQQSGIQVSVLDTLLGSHPGLNLRGSQSNCSIHVNLDQFAGQYGNPITGSFHIDEYNPLTFEPAASGLPLDINGGGMQPTSNMGPHVTQDVIPDLEIQAGMGTWTGNQECPQS
jgi:RHS repeat-associated protein